MKRPVQLLLTFTLVFILASCSLFRSQQSGTLFPFEYEGKTYEIAGYISEVGKSANYLTYREQDNVIFRAVDHNRTGVIDQVVSGSISVTEANKIYQAGIQIAVERNMFKNIDRNRTFESKYGDYQLMVETYQKREGEFHNRFILFNLKWELIAVYWDDDSDGSVDRSESGDLDLDTAQNLYRIVLDKAKESRRLLETDDNQFIISKNTKRNKELIGVSQ